MSNRFQNQFLKTVAGTEKLKFNKILEAYYKLNFPIFRVEIIKTRLASTLNFEQIIANHSRLSEKLLVQIKWRCSKIHSVEVSFLLKLMFDVNVDNNSIKVHFVLTQVLAQI